MHYLKTPEEKAAEKQKIETTPWPLDPFLPLKRRNKNGYGFPDVGFIYRGKLDAVYLVAIPYVFNVQENLTQSVGPSGMAQFGYHPLLIEKLPHEEILARLEKVPHESYTDLDAIIEGGWIVD